MVHTLQDEIIIATVEQKDRSKVVAEQVDKGRTFADIESELDVVEQLSKDELQQAYRAILLRDGKTQKEHHHLYSSDRSL